MEQGKICGKKKVRGLSDDCDSFRLSFSDHVKKFGKNMDEQQVRASLFAGADQKRSLQRVEMLGRENNAIQESIKMIDTYTDMGRHSMRSLKDQKQTLKKSRQKALDVMHSLGLSRSLLKLIERIDFRNSCLLFFCMILTLFIFGATWYYMRYLPRQPQIVSIQTVPISSSSEPSAVTISAAPGSGVLFADSISKSGVPMHKLDTDAGGVLGGDLPLNDGVLAR